MLVTRFDPFKELRNLERRFHDLYKEEESEISGFTPSVNTREGEFAYHIEADLPGVKKEDISIDVKDNIITISGERKTKNELNEKDYHKIETTFGTFSRRFTLPKNGDQENITASCEEGVLEVVIPKIAEEKETKKITIT